MLRSVIQKQCHCAGLTQYSLAEQIVYKLFRESCKVKIGLYKIYALAARVGPNGQRWAKICFIFPLGPKNVQCIRRI